MSRTLAAIFALAACTPPVEQSVHAPVHARPRAAAPPTIPEACEPALIAVGTPDVKPFAIASGQTAEVVTCKLQRGDDDGDFEWRAYLVQHGPRERADRIDEAIGGVGNFQEGAASAWVIDALPDSPLVFVEHSMFAMDIIGATIAVYRLDTDPPQLVHTFSGNEAAVEVAGGAATIRTCAPTIEQHEAGGTCLAHDAQVVTATVRWVGGALAVDEHPAAKPVIVTSPMLEASLARLAAEIAEPRHGIYGPRSVSWRLAGDIAVFVGGGRAALLQLAHPFVAFAIAEHSHTRVDVVGRFQRTFRNVFAMTFGDLDDAFVAARRVHAVHSRIHGVLPERVGSWAAGTPYAANDEAALRWVHATLVDTVLVVRERLDGALPAAIKDAYVVEQNRFARLFGIRDALLPQSWADHAAYMERSLAMLAVAPCAKEMGAFLIGRGGIHQPALGRVAESITATLLPRHLVRAFGLAESTRSAAAVHAALAAIGPLYRRLPARAIALPARVAAVRRIEGKSPSRLDAWSERQLFGLAQRTTGA